MSISVLDKVAVPLFFMVSGALLLGKNEPIRTILTKRVLRMVVVLVVFSAIYYLFGDFVLGTETPQLSSFFNASIWTPLYFIYAYISFLLALPLLRAIAQNMKANAWVFLIIVALLMQIFMLFSRLWLRVTLTGWVNSPLLTIWLGCPLVGYYLHNVVQISTISWKRCVFVCMGVPVIVAVSCFLVEKEIANGAAPNSQTYLNFFSPLLAGCFFIVIRWLFANISVGMSQTSCLRALGALVFGGYLLEGITRHYLFEPVSNLLAPYIGGMFAAFIATAGCFAAGLLCTWTLRLIPGVRHWL
jgi:surface polysaccharide O-acyltransferase-like enzyme